MPDHSHQVELSVQGMHCTNCALGVERQLQKMGLEQVSVSFATSTAQFTMSGENLLPQVITEIEKLGYTVGANTESGPGSRRFWTLERKLGFSLLFSVPLLLHLVTPIHFLHQPLVQFILCIPVFILGVLHFGRSALNSLKTGLPNMDVLIVIGIIAAFVYSSAGYLLGLGPEFLFFETAATITSVVLFGNLLEERSVRKTTSAIGELSKVQPSIARKIIEQNGKEILAEVPVSQINIGDRLQVNTGDKIPVDGVVYWGNATIDESMTSGESIPIERAIGGAVVGGTILVSGNLKMTATAVGENTVLANIIRLVKQAQSNKPSIQRIGDRVSAVFVPAVVAISIVTFLLSYFFLGVSLQDSLLRAIAVLVISCPCAMGLATPTAIMVGIGRAAQAGVLIKGGSTLEKFAQIRGIVFDKTGTLTTGRFKIGEITCAQSDLSLVKSVLVGLERHSSHPIAKSVVAELGTEAAAHEFKEIKETRGLGIAGLDSLGNQFLLSANGASGQHGAQDLYLTRNGDVIASLNIRDELKPGAKEIVAKIKDLGIESIIISGDKREKVEAIAKELGITHYYYQTLPEEKLKLLEQLERDKPIAFVGDGINDAPALARAAVGVSLSDATQAAINSAQVILLNGDLRHLLFALFISRKTLRVIKQNLFWAFLYNVLAIPVAAIGLLSPIIGCLAMAFSDVIVVLNSLRLRSTWHS